MKRFVGILLALIMVFLVNTVSAEARDGRHRGVSHFSFGVNVGPTWWGPGWGWGGPYYPYYPGYSYYPPPVIVQEPREIYTQPAPPAEEPVYWYYCPDPQGYYPYVKKCPKGWMKVVPPAEAPEGGE